MEIHVLLGFMLCSTHATSATTHSLQYFYTGVTAGTDLPEYTLVGMVDDEPFECYNSTIKKMSPKTEWMEKNEGKHYWDVQTQRQIGEQQTYKANVVVAMQRFNQTEGVHVYQTMCGCEWDDETGITDGFWNHGYDGEELLVFDLKNTRWISPSPQGLITTQRWNNDRAGLEYTKYYLTQRCIEWLKKYVSYGRSTLERTVAPEVSLLQKDPSSPVVCHVTGFFPRAVVVTWQKNEVDHYDDVEWGETLPNEDGTFQTTSRLTVKDWQTEDYTCIVEHKSLEEEIVKRVIEREIRRNQDIETRDLLMAVIIGCVVGVLLLAVRVVVWRKRGAGYRRTNTRGSPRDIIIMGGVFLLIFALAVVGVVVWKKSGAARGLIMGVIIVVGVLLSLAVVRVVVSRKRGAGYGKTNTSDTESENSELKPAVKA